MLPADQHRLSDRRVFVRQLGMPRPEGGVAPLRWYEQAALAAVDEVRLFLAGIVRAS